jgi:hypothetical protein
VDFDELAGVYQTGLSPTKLGYILGEKITPALLRIFVIDQRLHHCRLEVITKLLPRRQKR